MSDKKRHQSATERDLGGIAAKRERESIPKMVDFDATPPPLALPESIEIEGFDSLDPAAQEAFQVLQRGVNEALDGIGQVWHLRNATDLGRRLDTIARESAQSSALLTEFVMPAIKTMTARVSAVEGSSKADGIALSRVSNAEIPAIERELRTIDTRITDVSRAVESTGMALTSESKALASRDAIFDAKLAEHKAEKESLQLRVRALEDAALKLKTQIALLSSLGGALIAVLAKLIEKLF